MTFLFLEKSESFEFDSTLGLTIFVIVHKKLSTCLEKQFQQIFFKNFKFPFGFRTQKIQALRLQISAELSNPLCRCPGKKYKNCLKTNWIFFWKIVSHVVGVLKVYYLLSYAGGWLGRHCCGVATANTYKSR